MDLLGAVKLNDWVLIVVLVAATITDLKRGKIYNFLTVPAIAAGVVLAFFAGRTHGPSITASLTGAGIMLAVGLGLLMFRMVGGGDAKLLIAVGALEGSAFVAPSLLCSALAGGVLALLVVIRRRRLKRTVGTMAMNAAAQLLQKSPVLIPPDCANRMPYGLAIAAGCVAALVRIRMQWPV